MGMGIEINVMEWGRGSGKCGWGQSVGGGGNLSRLRLQVGLK